MQYSTPGVYVVEQNAFPNSVVEVATAIPAFVGYTEKSFYKGKELRDVPTRIESMQDFVAFFGGAPVQQFSLTVLPDGTATSVSTTVSPLPVAASTLTFTVNSKPAKYSLAPANPLFYLYNAIHLFYLNGGSTCYIVSIGDCNTDNPSNKQDFEDALETLKYEQDITMVLCPDARRLEEADYNEVMQQMLMHCADMQNRVAIFDLYDGAISDSRLVVGDDGPIAKFRSNIGQNNLKYGIAYFPWIETSVVSLSDVSFRNLTEDSLRLLLTTFNQDTPQQNPNLAQQTADKISAASKGGDLAIQADAFKDTTAKAATLRTTAVTSGLKAAKDQADADAIARTIEAVKAAQDVAQAADAIKAAGADPAALAKAQAEAKPLIAAAQAAATAAQKAADAAKQADDAVAADNKVNGVTTPAVNTNAQQNAQQASDQAQLAATNAQAAVATQDATAIGTSADAADTAAKAAAALTAGDPDAAATTAKASADQSNKDGQAADQADQQVSVAEKALEAAGRSAVTAIGQMTRATFAPALTKLVPALSDGQGPDSGLMENIFSQAVKLQSDNLDILKTATALDAKRQDIHNKLMALFPSYKQTITAAARYLSTLPVAPAMAGVYTATDSNYGVWKAPANVTLNTAIAPTVALSDVTQGTLNVDALSGKSVNAIRAFKGLGVMVWGGRTLDGNSDDWRYVNVRRTMMMIEQSVKLAARAYVFEPNTPNTWATLRSMINSFLFNLWKQGALLGTSPTEAYTVNVGLGSTMTTDDVLEGLLKVTVLVALVRPAEFIVLTFEQQMPGAGA